MRFVDGADRLDIVSAFIVLETLEEIWRCYAVVAAFWFLGVSERSIRSSFPFATCSLW